MIALDTECTGLDLYHGATPYFVSVCDEDRRVSFWEWEVDPLTRAVCVPKEDVKEIGDLLAQQDWSRFAPDVAGRHGLVAQNGKFDCAALASIGVGNWPWSVCHDTLIASHVLASNQPHDLTSLALHYLGVDIQPYEDTLQDACVRARRLARKHFANWRIAKAGLPEMPSVKASGSDRSGRGTESEKSWKSDGWLPRRIAQELGPPDFPDDHPWHTVLKRYANADSAVTLALWIVLHKELHKRGLWEWYVWKNRLMELAYRMERKGVTVSQERMESQEKEFRAKSQICKSVCRRIAKQFNYDLQLPVKGLNNSLRDFCFGPLGLPVVKTTDNGNASLDKYALEIYQVTLEPGSVPLRFLTSLLSSRKADTALGFIESYKKFGLPFRDGWLLLHPSTNPCGTDSTRFSMSNPNGQQIAKQEEINLRKSFGPAPGREWYSADAKNIELRIPAYVAGEKDMIALFEKSKEPPFYGSNHLLNFSTIYPDIWEKELAEVGIDRVGPHVKSKYDGSWYTYAKNTGLGIQYRAGRATADKAAHRPGAYDLIHSRFAAIHGIDGLNDRLVRFARKHGYVETLPDKSINPKQGYPLMVARNEFGKVLDTTPLNYMVQGTAGVWMGQALLRCQAQLDRWFAEDGFDGFITLTVHDEIVFDLPVAADNREKMTMLRELMEQGGEDIGVPTPVSVEYHENNWAEGVEI